MFIFFKQARPSKWHANAGVIRNPIAGAETRDVSVNKKTPNADVSVRVRLKKRPHQTLGYMPPINFSYKYHKVLPMYPSSTTN